MLALQRLEESSLQKLGAENQCAPETEQPRVVVTRATQTAQNSTGHSRRFLVCVFLVTRCDFSAKQGRNLEFRASCREGCWASRRRRTTVSSDTQPRRNYHDCHRGRGVPWPSSFQGCGCCAVLQVIRLQNRHHWRAGSCSAGMPSDVREPEQTPQGPHSRF